MGGRQPWVAGWELSVSRWGRREGGALWRGGAKGSWTDTWKGQASEYGLDLDLTGTGEPVMVEEQGKMGTSEFGRRGFIQPQGHVQDPAEGKAFPPRDSTVA